MEKENKAILESLERLKRNADYQYLCTHLKWIQELIEIKIFDENESIDKKQILISKRNSIKNFIELTEDLIKQFNINE